MITFSSFFRTDSNSMQFINHRADVNHDSDNHSISSISNHSDDDNLLNQVIFFRNFQCPAEVQD